MKRLIIICAAILAAVSSEAQINRDSILFNATINMQRLQQVMTAVNGMYLDTVNNDKMVNKAISEMLLTLDPHSTFIPNEDVQSTNESLEGSFEGVGIEFAIINDTLTVQNVIQGGPSMKVGMLSGDKIVKVDGENVAGVGISTTGVRSKLRGPRGSKVTVEVVRGGVDEPLEFVITRDVVPLNSVDAAYLLDGNIFYLRLGQFAQNSLLEIVDEMMKLEHMPSGIILDLRSNGGGYLISALRIAGLFMKEKELILYSEGLNSPREDYHNDRNGAYLNGPLVVMVDESSASASEIVAGALQDWDRAIIVGRRSFGKGLVQRQINLADGSQIRLTTSRYHTPSGRVIQSPYENGHRQEYYDNNNARYSSGELFHQDSIRQDTSKEYYTMVKKRVVYGGGGINPDIFVPMDTTGNSNYYSELVRKGVLQEYVNKYVDANRHKLMADSASFEAFELHLDAELDDVFDGLVEYASEHGVERNDEQIAISREIIGIRMKALVANVVFGTTGYYRVINKDDDDFAAALDAIHNWKDFWKDK